jgi:hypothetical protein
MIDIDKTSIETTIDPDYDPNNVDEPVIVHDYPIPDVVPFYTPQDMLTLGVFNEDPDKNYYGVKSTMESKKWFDQYVATGIPDMQGYFKRVNELYSESVKHPEDKSLCQRMLEMGWAPGIKPDPKVLKKVEAVKESLYKLYAVTLVDLTHD